MSIFKFENILNSLRTAINVREIGSQFQEQKTELDVVDGAVTFIQPITFVEIYNRDENNVGVFNVNGLYISVPPKEVFKAEIGGTPSEIVRITNSSQYIISRYL